MKFIFIVSYCIYVNYYTSERMINITCQICKVATFILPCKPIPHIVIFAQIKKYRLILILFSLTCICYYTSDKWIYTQKNTLIAKFIKLLYRHLCHHHHCPIYCNIDVLLEGGGC